MPADNKALGWDVVGPDSWYPIVSPGLDENKTYVGWWIHCINEAYIQPIGLNPSHKYALCLFDCDKPLVYITTRPDVHSTTCLNANPSLLTNDKLGTYWSRLIPFFYFVTFDPWLESEISMIIFPYCPLALQHQLLWFAFCVLYQEKVSIIAYHNLLSLIWEQT